MSTFKQLQSKRLPTSAPVAPTSSLLRPSRPLLPVSAPAPEPASPVTQAELERAGRLGHSFARIPLFPPASDDARAQGEPLQGRFEATQSRENNTGMPDKLKAGIESLSGMSMDDVNVHYNSSKPAQLQALAYTQGTEIHVVPGQESHLPHEAWHVVQQKQGRVKPTLQAKGVAINDDQELEREADVMGVRALQTKSSLHGSDLISKKPYQGSPTQRVIQRALNYATPATKVNLDTDLGANPRAISRFSYAETLSKDWGVVSDTKQFSNANDSDYLDSGRNGNAISIGWNGVALGYLRPLGKIKPLGFDPNVKLHLVNSFLHPDANTWPLNWVFGHGDLNHKHENDVESKAKDYHPGNPAATHKTLTSGEAIYALSYRTEVVSNATTTKTANDIADSIVAGINLKVPFGYTGVLRNDVLANVKIKAETVPNYHARWNAAIGNAVASKVESFMRIYGIDATTGNPKGEDVNLGAVEDKDDIEYRVVINDNVDGMLLASNGIITPIPTPPGASRPKRSTGAPSGGSSKKGKVSG